MADRGIAARLQDIVTTFISNARSVNAAARERAAEHALLVGEAAASSDRLAKMARAQEDVRAYFRGGEERIVILRQQAADQEGCLRDLRHHLDDILRDESALQAALVAVSSQADALSDIAQMARLLALNASVEAARAGEAGAGFAVVAREMRALSDQSGGRAEEIDSLVRDVAGKLSGLKARVRGTDAPMGALDRAVTILSDTLSKSAKKAGAASDVMDDVGRTMVEEMEVVTGLMNRLQNLTLQSEAAINGSAENISLGEEALGLLTSGVGSVAPEMRRNAG